MLAFLQRACADVHSIIVFAFWGDISGSSRRIYWKKILKAEVAGRKTRGSFNAEQGCTGSMAVEVDGSCVKKEHTLLLGK